jgi:hypothetical protein
MLLMQVVKHPLSPCVRLNQVNPRVEQSSMHSRVRVRGMYTRLFTFISNSSGEDPVIKGATCMLGQQLYAHYYLSRVENPA